MTPHRFREHGPGRTFVDLGLTLLFSLRPAARLLVTWQGRREGVCCGNDCINFMWSLDFAGHCDPWNYRQKTHGYSQSNPEQITFTPSVGQHNSQWPSQSKWMKIPYVKMHQKTKLCSSSFDKLKHPHRLQLLYDSNFKGIQISTAETGVCITDMQFPASKQSSSICHIRRHPSLVDHLQWWCICVSLILFCEEKWMHQNKTHT